MPRLKRIGIVGDYDPGNPTHIGTNEALWHVNVSLGTSLEVSWVPTEGLAESFRPELSRFDGLLIAPGSPYRSMEGALNAIRWAREEDAPVLGTCGGFQHMIVEFARNVLGVADADHAETHPTAEHPYVTPLACSLVGRTEPVTVVPGSRAFESYRSSKVIERFYCNFGLNPSHRAEVEKAGLRTSGTDRNGEVRIMELPSRRFFLGTLFVPQMSSTRERPHPLVLGLARSLSQ